MKIIFIMTALCSLFYLTTHAQDGAKSDFQVRMNQHIALKISDPAFMATAKEIYGHTCEKHHTVTEEEIKARAAEAEKHSFIQANMDEYMRLYFPAQVSSRSITADTFICDNGGFENDFLYYKGYVSTFTTGSNTCTPDVSGWTPVVMPVTNRLEIMSPGLDPLVGIQKVKFGNKSLRINSQFGHINQCDGNYGIDKVTKRFKVTEENRRFTIWYAVALENPADHVNQQPFLNIKCDKAPADELCFDADFLKCAKFYSNPCSYNNIDVLNWSCHRFNIPASEIGTIATIEMIVADCGQSAHFGYAYIDGFCEECTGSSLGSVTLSQQSPIANNIGIDYKSCLGKKAYICGSYSLPVICGLWKLDSLKFNGVTIEALDIDYDNKSFCFYVDKAAFGNQDCLEFNVTGYFSNPLGQVLIQQSNVIQLCKDKYYTYFYQYRVSECHDNGTPNNISDDYYFVSINLANTNGSPWSIQRQLDDPYPNESGLSSLATGSGDQYLVLGPFLIQEGSWHLKINFPDCSYTEPIIPPDYCGSCNLFNEVQITNISCDPMTNTWGFDLFVPSNGISSTYIISEDLTGVGTFGVTKSFTGLPIITDCLKFKIETNIGCFTNITICPPKPCKKECNLEVQITDFSCTETSFTYTLDFTGVGLSSICYKAIDPNNGIASTQTQFSSSGIAGPFSNDVYLMVYACDNPDCFKMIYLPKPKCTFDPKDGIGKPKQNTLANDIKVVPNPVQSNEFSILSSFDKIRIEIYNTNGQLLYQNTLFGNQNYIHLDIPSGLYLLKSTSEAGEIISTKFSVTK
jgi:hypothetical protein